MDTNLAIKRIKAEAALGDLTRRNEKEAPILRDYIQELQSRLDALMKASTEIHPAVRVESISKDASAAPKEQDLAAQLSHWKKKCQEAEESLYRSLLEKKPWWRLR